MFRVPSNPQLNLAEFEKALNEHGYDLISIIGNGCFAHALKVMSRAYNTEFVAKVVFSEQQNMDSLIQSYETEISALRQIPHVNVIRIYDYFTEDEKLYIILEYCSGGTIEDYVTANGPMSVEKIQKWGARILDALRFCHSHGVVHRDIKPSNIFIDKYNRPKIADFGLAHKIKTGTKLSGTTGSRGFLAPEVWSRKPFDPMKTDIWALGIVFFYMATGKYCWTLKSGSQTVLDIITGPVEYPDNFPENLKSVISMMLTIDPIERATAEEVLASPFFEEGKTKQHLGLEPATKRGGVLKMPSIVRLSTRQLPVKGVEVSLSQRAKLTSASMIVKGGRNVYTSKTLETFRG